MQPNIEENESDAATRSNMKRNEKENNFEREGTETLLVPIDLCLVKRLNIGGGDLPRFH